MKTPKYPCTVLVARQNTFVNHTVTALLLQQGYQTTAYEDDTDSLVERVQALQPDFVLLDADNQGLERSRQVRAILRLATKCILFFPHQERYFLAALFIDISGYLYDNAPAEEMLFCLQRLRGGERYINPVMMRHFDKPGVLSYQSMTAPLSEREREVFRYLGYGHTTAQIGNYLCISPKTVEAHFEHMKQKLTVVTTKELRLKAIIAVAQLNEASGESLPDIGAIP